MSQSNSCVPASPCATDRIAPGDRLLKLADVLGPKGPIAIGKTSWWQGVREGRFPAPVRLGPKCVRWRASDIQRLVAQGPLRPAASKA